MTKVLVVEDDLHTALLVSTLLKRHGFETFTADNVMDAQSVLENDEDIALVILDILLPGPSGTNLLGTLQREYPHIQVLIVSAHVDTLSTDLAVIGDIPRLTKPFSKQQFDDAIHQLGILRR
jgi:DNA-binding NtrC family response regulator